MEIDRFKRKFYKMLKGRKILFIGPKFFGYEIEITKTLISLGAKVDFYDERPKNSFLVRVFIRLNFKFLINDLIEKYYNLMFDEVKNNRYDYIFVVSPETLNFEKIKRLKSLQPHSKFILYMWDSFKNKNSFNIINLFHDVVTFDNRDAKEYKLRFLPLFYIKDYENIQKLDSYKYDLCFTATAHSDRYSIATSIKKQLIKKGFSMFTYFYLPSKIMYWIRKLFIKKYKYGNITDFSFSSLTQLQIIEIIENSKVVLDINHPFQYGLTSRCIEALGAKRKLVTTNSNIVEYDFFNPNNIFVIDRNKPIINISFFETEYTLLPKSIYEKYSLENWLIAIFNN